MILLAYSGTGKTHVNRLYPNVMDTEDYLYYDNNGQVIIPLLVRALINTGIYQDGIALAHPSQKLRYYLLANNIPYILVMPELNTKKEYLDRFRKRGSLPEFIENQDKTWEERHKIISDEESIITLKKNEYLSDKIDALKIVWQIKAKNYPIESIINNFKKELKIK